MGGTMHQVPVGVWLASMGLAEYGSLFAAYSDVASLMSLSEMDFKNLGLSNMSHRSRLYNSLILLRDKTITATKEAKRSSASNTSLLRRSSSTLVESNSESLLTCSWYHGPLSYQRAESLLRKNGDFLLRESVSQPGTFVLSCRWKHECLHVVVSANEGKGGTTNYGFDGEVYSTVPALVTAIVGERKPVTAATGALISSPVHRIEALAATINEGLLETHRRPLLTKSLTTSAIGKKNPKDRLLLHKSMTTKDLLSPPNHGGPRRGSGLGGRVFSVPQLTRSSSMDVGGIGRSSGAGKGSHAAPSLDKQIHFLPGSQPNLLDTVHEQVKSESAENVENHAPPKPSRVPSTRRKDGGLRPVVKVRNRELYEDDGRDYSEIDQVTKTPAILITNPAQDKFNNNNIVQILKSQKKLKSSSGLRRGKPAFSSTSQLISPSRPVERSTSVTYDHPTSRPLHQFVHPPSSPTPRLHLDSFTSPLLPPSNKALYPDSLASIKALLAQRDYKTLACHLSLVDYSMLQVTGTKDIGAGVTTGPEMMTLPQGSAFREAVIERHHSLVYFVAVTIVMMNATDERAFMLKRWISIAAELIRNHGNMMSFYAIVEGILHPTVDRLSNTWASLSRTDPTVVNIFRSKIATTYKSLSTCTNGPPIGDLSLPHLLPLAQLMDRDDYLTSPAPPTTAGHSTATARPSAPAIKHFSWETQDESGTGGLDLLLAHLDTARLVTGQTADYRAKALTVERSLGATPEPLLLDLFRVEMHMRLLFGCYGCRAPRQLRWDKFQHILAILSNKIETHGADTEL